MRLKVEMGKGRAKSQKVTTEDGELVEGVKEIRWVANAAGPPMLHLELFAEKVEFDTGPEPTPIGETAEEADRE